MRTLDLTPATWVQEQAEISAREIRAKNYSAARKNHKENVNELVCGIMLATFIVGFLMMGLFMQQRQKGNENVWRFLYNKEKDFR